MASTAGTIIGLAQDKVKFNRTTIALPGLQSAHLLHVIDQADREYNNKFKLGGGEPKRTIATEDGGTLVATTTLSADADDGATSFSVASATNATDGGGAAAIWDENMPDIVEYTNGSASPITGVTLLDFAHESGDLVQWLPALPSNFGSFRGTDDNPGGVWVNGVPFQPVSGVPYTAQYRLYDNGTTQYILFPQGLTGDYFLRYNKSGTTIDEESDNVTVPVEDEDFLTFRLVEHCYRTLDPVGFATLAEIARRNANKILLDALKRRNLNKRLRVGRPVEISSDYDFHARLFPDSTS